MKRSVPIAIAALLLTASLAIGCSSKKTAHPTPEEYFKKLDEIGSKMEEQIALHLDANKRFADLATELFNKPWPSTPLDPKIYTRDRFGILSDHGRHGKINVYVDKTTPIDAHTRGFVNISQQFINLWEDNYKLIPDIGWQFLTETKFNSMSIFPWVETTRSFGPEVDWPTYGFYSCASPKSNPERKTCWGRIGNDMLGLGLISSVSTPIYRGDEFVGIATTDFLITKSFQKYLNERLPQKNDYLILVNDDSEIILRDDRDEGERSWDTMFKHRFLNEFSSSNKSIGDLIDSFHNSPKGFIRIDVGTEKTAFFKKLDRAHWILMIIAEN